MLSSDWITVHQALVLVLCVRDVIKSQIDKCASYGKVCGQKENPIGVGSQWSQRLKIPENKNNCNDGNNLVFCNLLQFLAINNNFM